MSILDMDVTPRRHAGYIRTREFASIRKGYDPAQVRQFLDQVAGWFSEMEDDLANSRTAEVNARAQAEAAASGRAALARTPEGEAVAGADDKYAALGARVAEVLRTAEEHAAQVREEAEASVHQMLEQARLESTSLRHRAQEEADAIGVSAQQQAETTRQAAQDDADRVRDEAARALETARVEAERTVAGLTERRTVLTAELQATRARLLGIVSQLEDDQEDPFVDEADDVTWTGPTTAPRAGTGVIPPDDPRRDPLPLDIPAFVPPPAPARTPFARPQELDASEGSFASLVADQTEATPDAASDEEDPSLAEDSGRPPQSAADPADETGEGSEAAIRRADSAIAVDGAAPEAEGTSDEELAASGEMEASSGESEADSDHIDESPSGASFLQWTPEESKGDLTDLDLTLPDFPSIDFPTVEDEERRRS